jgi:hypothetical protein
MKRRKNIHWSKVEQKDKTTNNQSLMARIF